MYGGFYDTVTGGTRLNGAKGAEEESWDDNTLNFRRRRCSPHSPSQSSPSHDQSTRSSHRVNGRAAVEEWMDGGGGGQAGGTYIQREREGERGMMGVRLLLGH